MAIISEWTHKIQLLKSRSDFCLDTTRFCFFAYQVILAKIYLHRNSGPSSTSWPPQVSRIKDQPNSNSLCWNGSGDGGSLVTHLTCSNARRCSRIVVETRAHSWTPNPHLAVRHDKTSSGEAFSRNEIRNSLHSRRS